MPDDDREKPSPDTQGRHVVKNGALYVVLVLLGLVVLAAVLGNLASG